MDVSMKGFLHLIISKVKIEDVLNERGILSSKNYGDKLVYKCPIHKGDNSPSFYVYKKNSGDDFFCYGCKSGGNVIKLVQLLNNCSSKDAIQIVSDRAGVNCDPYLYDIDFDIGSIEDYEISESIESYMLSITLFYRKSRQHGALDVVDKIDSIWSDLDSAYWSMNLPKIKELHKWINGK